MTTDAGRDAAVMKKMRQAAPMRRPTQAGRAYRPTMTDRFLEEHEDETSSSVERYVGGGGESVRVDYKGPALVVLYFPTTWGWESREVPAHNIRTCVRQGGARYDCGDCDGNCSPDPMNPQYNNCPGREKFAAMQCPDCGRLAYDFEARSVNADLLQPVNDLRAGEAEGTLLEDPTIAKLTPQMRLATLNAQHMRRYHPDTAEARGLGREGQRV